MKCVVYGVGFSFQVIVNLISLTCSKFSPYLTLEIKTINGHLNYQARW